MTLLEQQKLIIKNLSGDIELANGKTLKARSTKEERKLSREYLSEIIISIGLKPEYHSYKMPNINPLVDLLFNPFKGANIYTILPATTESDEYIVIGAHFDSKRNCPGAIDNGSGIAITFGAVSRLADLQSRRVNIILVYFDQEEEELVGSQAFAKKLKKEKLNILSVHTIDTMGWDSDGDNAIELELPTEYLKSIYVEAGKKLDIPIYTTKVNSTDHHSFRELGFNATGLTDELVNGDFAPFKDTEKDTYQTVNFDFITSSTQLLYEVIKTEIE
ncbi:M28 family peptidase [Winogradskyella maritima]|nr:M28 family peptidase [Winogradskyella maritima]